MSESLPHCARLVWNSRVVVLAVELMQVANFCQPKIRQGSMRDLVSWLVQEAGRPQGDPFQPLHGAGDETNQVVV